MQYHRIQISLSHLHNKWFGKILGMKMALCLHKWHSIPGRAFLPRVFASLTLKHFSVCRFLLLCVCWSLPVLLRVFIFDLIASTFLDLLEGSNILWCPWTASCCLTSCLAFSRVKLDSIWSCLDNAWSTMIISIDHQSRTNPWVCTSLWCTVLLTYPLLGSNS